MTSMTELDSLVRQSILRHPSLFTTRWQVLEHLYLVIGNGYEWSNGRLVSVFDDEKSEDECVAEFFRDIDEFQSQFPDMPGHDTHTLRRRRRQFVLDNLDLLTHERRIDSGIRFDAERVISTTPPEYSHAFHVPHDVEPSFRAGAIETLGELIPGLYFAEALGKDRGLRRASVAELHRLDGPHQEAMQHLLTEILEQHGE